VHRFYPKKVVALKPLTGLPPEDSEEDDRKNDMSKRMNPSLPAIGCSPSRAWRFYQ
jgi:hypothetical protein